MKTLSYKTIFTFIILTLINFNFFSQNIKLTSIKEKFLQNLIQENILRIKDDKNVLNCPNLISIDLDSLNNYNSDILFYRFIIGKNSILSLNENVEISFNSSSCNEYILAFNINNYNSYRMKGFNGNDLLFLLRDINQMDSSKVSPKKLILSLNNLNIGIDFKCIYKALLSLDLEAECLKTCSDGKEAHGKIYK